MRRQENVISKTVRMDAGLAEAVMAQLKENHLTYNHLNFSEAVRLGLVLVLAAYGETYKEPSEWNRMKICGSYRHNQILEIAQGDLLESAESRTGKLLPK